MQDVHPFKRQIREDAAARAFLADNRAASPIVLARAPGRLDVMGGVGDYSGSLVAEMTIAEAALVALAPRTDRRLRFWSLGLEAEGLTPQVELSLDDFRSGGSLADYADVQPRLRANSQTRWAGYLAGCFYVLLAEGLLPDFPHGANVILDSRVPLGAGVSSSAAIEVATMQAIRAAYGLPLDGVTLARLAQTVENRVVGAPCGIMDQMTSALGVANSLLLILCRPHEIQGTQTLPPGVRIFGINSNVKHSVGGSAYTRARVAAFMGRKILGVDYLADIEPHAGSFVVEVPEEMTGVEFLAAYGETGDAVTRVDPATTYPVREATLHGVLENDRVQKFVHFLSAGGSAASLDRAGRLMYEAHEGYGRIGLGSVETDLLVELGRQAGPKRGIYGAKITGGGSGGTAAFLTYGEDVERTIRHIANEYQRQTSLTPQIFEGGLSPGAVAFGHETLE